MVSAAAHFALQRAVHFVCASCIEKRNIISLPAPVRLSIVMTRPAREKRSLEVDPFLPFTFLLASPSFRATLAENLCAQTRTHTHT